MIYSIEHKSGGYIETTSLAIALQHICFFLDKPCEMVLTIKDESKEESHA